MIKRQKLSEPGTEWNLNVLEEEAQEEWRRLMANGAKLPGKKKPGRRRQRRREEEEEESLSGEDERGHNACWAMKPARKLEPQWAITQK